MKNFRTAGLVFYSILALTAITTVFVHVWHVQTDLRAERKLGAEFRKA